MVFYITGSNLFGQWLCDDILFNEFRELIAVKNDLEITLDQANFLDMNWAYNILEINGEFFLSGAWDGKEQQLIKLPLPKIITKDYINCQIHFTIVGNDYKIVIVGKNLNTLWVMDIKNKNDIKQINFNVEEPVEDCAKKPKIANSITKVVLSNNSCLYLTSGGNVYSGVLPSYVDTRHCKGKIKDIQCGYEHFVLLSEEGRVYTWGNGRRLQLGHGDISNQELPTEVDALAGIKIIKICAGGWHTLALSTFGDLYAWGWNDTGQLGLKTSNEEGHNNYSIPTLIDLFDEHEEQVVKNITDIACGSRHSVVLLEDYTIWTTGCNKYGQCGFSEKDYPTLNYFKKAFHCDGECSLMCGPWNTVIHSYNIVNENLLMK